MYKEVSLEYCLRYFCKYPDRDVKILLHSEDKYEFKSIRELFANSICFINTDEVPKALNTSNNREDLSEDKQTEEMYKNEKVGLQNDKIDKGKIIALRKNGWTYKAIAEDVGCSITTVQLTLKKHGVSKK